MKKMNRILSFVLVMALLLTSLVIPSGAAPKTGTSIDPDTEVFTPTANFTQITSQAMGNTYLQAIELTGNGITGRNFQNMLGNGNLDAYYVEPDGSSEYSSEPYMLIVPSDAAKRGGGTAYLNGHNYLETACNKKGITYAGSENNYLIWEADVATESTYLPLGISIVTRSDKGSHEPGYYEFINSSTNVYEGLTDGRFHHLTVVGDLYNNVIHLYIDGVYKGTHNELMRLGDDTTDARGYIGFKNGTAENLYIDSVRLQIGGGSYRNFSDDASYAIKNINAEHITLENSSADRSKIDAHIASVYTPLAANDMLPYLVEINGVKYNNSTMASAVLNTYKTGNKVEALRAFYGGYITINCEATVNTYATASFPLKEGANVTLTKIDASTWIATPDQVLYSTNKIAEVSSNPAYNVFADIEDNKLTSTSVNAPGSIVSFDIMELIDGDTNRYIYAYDAEPNNVLGNEDHYYLNFNTGNITEITASGYRYITFDMDIFAEHEFINFYSGFNLRIDIENSLSSVRVYIDQLPVNVGVWNHLTFVGDLEANKLYVLLDGRVVYSENGFYPDGYDTDAIILSSFRTLQIYGGDRSGMTMTDTMSVAIDNSSLRLLTDDYTLETATLYDDSYEFPDLPVLAEVDGTPYYSTHAVEDAVHQNFNDLNVNLANKDAVFYYQFHGEVTFDGRVTVNENGVTSGKFGCSDECTYDVYTDTNTGTTFIETYKNVENTSRTNQTVADYILANGNTASAVKNAYDFIVADCTEDDKSSKNLLSIDADISLSDNSEFVTSVKNETNWTFLRLPAGSDTFSISRNENTNATSLFASSTHYFSISFDIAYLGSNAPAGLSFNIDFNKVAADGETSSAINGGKTLDVGKQVLANTEPGEFKHITILFKSPSTDSYKKEYYPNNYETLREFANTAWVFADNVLIGTYKDFFGENAASELFENGTEEGVTGALKYNINLASFGFTSSSSDDMLIDNLALRTHTGMGTAFYLSFIEAGQLVSVYNEYSNSVAIPTAHPLYIDTDDYSYPIHTTNILGAVERVDSNGNTAVSVYSVNQYNIMLADMNTYDYDPITIFLLRTPSTPFTLYNNATITFNGLVKTTDDNGNLLSEDEIKANRDKVITLNTAAGEIAHYDGDTLQVVNVSVPYQLDVTNTSLPNYDSTSVYNAIKYSTQDTETPNIFKSVHFNGYPKQRNLTITTDITANNSYVRDYIKEGLYATNNAFTQWQVNDPQYTYGADTEGKYLAISFDLALNSLNGENGYKAEIRHTTASGADSSSTFHIVNYLDETMVESFVHIDIIGDISNNCYHIYINGECKGQSIATMYSGNNASEQYFAFIRLGQHSGISALYDNVYIRIVDSVEGFTAGNDLPEALKIYDSSYIFPGIRPICSIDGKLYYSIADVESVLIGNYIKNVVLFQKPGAPINVGCPITLETHNLGEADELITCHSGYKIGTVTESSTAIDSCIVTTVKTTDYTTLKIIVTADGIEQTIVDDRVLIGTDVETYLMENGILCDKVVAGGAVYRGVTWDGSAPSGTVTGDTLFTGNATDKVEESYIYVANDGSITATDDATVFVSKLQSGLWASASSTAVLNKDLTYSKSISISPNGEINLYLNGHTIDFGTSAGHAFSIGGGSGHFNVYGGTVDYANISNTKSMIYTDQSFTGTVTFTDVNVNSSSNILALRSGHAVFNSCSINCYTVNGQHAFALGEDFMSGTAHRVSVNPMSLSLINTDVQYRFTDIQDQYYESTTPINNYALIGHKIVTLNGKTDPETHVYIDGCNILAKGYLIKTYDTNNTTDNNNKSNLNVYILDSTVSAKGISYENAIKSGTVIFYDDVRTNIVDTSGVSFVYKLTVAKTDNDMMPYLYTSHDFATVTWSDGETTEAWASGSIPTNDSFKFDGLNAIAAAGGLKEGETVKLTKTMSSAPFSFISNLTLADYIGFNIYIPSTQNVTAVYINSKLAEKSTEAMTLDGKTGEFYSYTGKFDPKNAVRSFNIIIVLDDGAKVMSRSASVTANITSIIDKIDKAEKDGGYNDDQRPRNTAYVYSVMKYIQQAIMYSGYQPKSTDMSAFMYQYGRVSSKLSDKTITGTESETKPSTHIVSAQINISDTAKFRFNLAKNGDSYYEADKFTFSLEGSTDGIIVTHSQDGSYIELSIRAYEMSRVITISYDGEEIGTYSLYDYYETLKDMIDDTATYDQMTRAECTQAKKLIEVLWSYAEYVDEYSLRGDIDN